MQAQFLHIHAITRIRRSHTLPVPGNVRVHVGQMVNTGDLLAEVEVPTSHISVDVSKALGLPACEDTEKMIERKVGEVLEERDIIAETGGLFSRILRTPAPGRIVSIDKGKMLIESGIRRVTLEARIPGTVTEIRKNQRIYIEANGSLVQGVWGNGKMGLGPLINACDSRNGALSPASFGLEMRGAIVMGGICMDEDTLKQAANLPIAGLILGSIPSRLLQAVENQPYPVLLTDGFGLMGMNEAAYGLLSTSHGRETTVNAVQLDLENGIHPEAFIYLPVEAQPVNEFCDFQAGQWVRVTAYPYAGQTGIIEKISPASAFLPSGLRAQAAEVKLGQEKRIIPLANLEVISIESEVSAETK